MCNRRCVVGVEAGQLPVERSQIRLPNAAAGFRIFRYGGMMSPALPFVLRDADLQRRVKSVLLSFDGAIGEIQRVAVAIKIDVGAAFVRMKRRLNRSGPRLAVVGAGKRLDSAAGLDSRQNSSV